MQSNVEVIGKPTVKVTLELTPREFALIYLLEYRYNGGWNTVRRSVGQGLESALDKLPEDVREQVVTARNAQSERRDSSDWEFPSDYVMALVS